MRYLFGFLCVCALGVVPLSASAQGGEEGATFEQNLQEPAPEEPALQLKLDDAGVEVVPSPPRTADGYTLEEMDVRVRRARLGLGFSAVATTVVGPLLIFVGAAASFGSCSSEPCSPDPLVPALYAAGALVTVGGLVGMGVSGSKLRRRKRDRDRLRQAHYGRPPRVQWDLAQSRLVF